MRSNRKIEYDFGFLKSSCFSLGLVRLHKFNNQKFAESLPDERQFGG